MIVNIFRTAANVMKAFAKTAENVVSVRSVRKCSVLIAKYQDIVVNVMKAFAKTAENVSTVRNVESPFVLIAKIQDPVRNAWGVSATNVGVWWLAHCVVKPIVAIANQEIVNSVVNFIVEIVHKKYYICVYACLLHITNQTRYQKKGGKHVTYKKMIYSYGGTYY